MRLADCYSLFVIRYSLFAIRYTLLAICYSLFAIRWSLFVTRYSLFATRCSFLATGCSKKSVIRKKKNPGITPGHGYSLFAVFRIETISRSKIYILLSPTSLSLSRISATADSSSICSFTNHCTQL
jgi:hypothetical protein